uniref:Adenylate cyclase n=1 Tax=Cyanothece sp. (strain PCC 7425 / ATCC 29141) TaxID=395961 RepID=B8HQE2_CYAP4
MGHTPLSDFDFLQYQNRLRFPKRLEQAFQQDFYQNSLRFVRAAMLIVTLPTAAFAILDYWAAPVSWPMLWLIRLCIVIALVGISLLLKLPLFQPLFPWMSALAAQSFALGIATMIAVSQPGEVAFDFYYIGLVISNIGGPAAFALLFWPTIALEGLTFLTYGMVTLFEQHLLATPESRVRLMAALFFMVGSLQVGLVSGYFNERRQRRDFLQRCVIEQQRLEAEDLRLQAENLLLNILPPEIADQLKQTNDIIAEEFSQASILFADIVNFTTLSASLNPTEVVKMLNEVFSYFDLLTEKYDLEKIKTIGDCYMVAAGVPRPRSDHAHALAQLALDIRDYSEANSVRGHKLTFRIGINSGPVTAGVIGRKKFIYDLWGDAVNTASRMESHGSGGHIQITHSTYQLIRAEFNCQMRGVVQIKGKGEMKVYLLIGRNF